MIHRDHEEELDNLLVVEVTLPLRELDHLSQNWTTWT